MDYYHMDKSQALLTLPWQFILWVANSNVSWPIQLTGAREIPIVEYFNAHSKSLTAAYYFPRSNGHSCALSYGMASWVKSGVAAKAIQEITEIRLILTLSSITRNKFNLPRKRHFSSLSPLPIRHQDHYPPSSQSRWTVQIQLYAKGTSRPWL